MSIDTGRMPTVEELFIVDALINAEQALRQWSVQISSYERAKALEEQAKQGGFLSGLNAISEATSRGRVIEAIERADTAIFDAMNIANTHLHEPLAREWFRLRATAKEAKVDG